MPNKFNLPEQYRKYYHALEPMLAKPKTKQYSTVIFFFLVVALFGWYAIKPTVQTILYLRREIVDKKAVNQKMDEKIQALIEAQALIETAGQRTSYIDDATPLNPNAIDVVRILNSLASNAGATISAIQVDSTPMLPGATASASKAYSVKDVGFSITMGIEGQYSALSNFLTSLLTIRRIVTIESITFSPNKKPSSFVPLSPTIQLVLKLNAYYRAL